jgi:hypothetical protein
MLASQRDTVGSDVGFNEQVIHINDVVYHSYCRGVVLIAMFNDLVVFGRRF